MSVERGSRVVTGLLALVVACGGGGGGGSPPPGATEAEATTPPPASTAPTDAGPPSAEASAVYPTPDIDVDPTVPGRAIPGDFLGLSVEWSHVLDYLTKAQTVELMNSFAAEGHTPVLRVGGDSEDAAWWNPSGAPRPDGVTIDIGNAHLSTLASLHAALGTRFVLGLNLLLGSGESAGALANAALAALPPSSILAFELGNEPDLYVLNGKRNLLYGFDSFKSEMDQLRNSVASHVVPAPPFAAPALGTPSWLPNLGAFYGAEAARVSLITTHVYPYTTPCLKLPPPAPADLLTNAATSDISAKYAPYVQSAHAAGYAFRMAEMNSVSCGGADGVSNSYASALWGAHIAFELAAAGLDGVNFHTPGTYYAAFSFDGAGALTVRPLYYGMRFFSLATANGGALVPAKTLPTSSPSVHAWATRDKDGAVRVAILNEGSTTASLRVRATGKSGAASIVRLTGPSLAAKSGLALGAQTWDGSTDGKPLGAPATETASFDGDAYAVSLPPLQAALLVAP